MFTGDITKSELISLLSCHAEHGGPHCASLLYELKSPELGKWGENRAIHTNAYQCLETSLKHYGLC